MTCARVRAFVWLRGYCMLFHATARAVRAGGLCKATVPRRETLGGGGE